MEHNVAVVVFWAAGKKKEVFCVFLYLLRLKYIIVLLGELL